MRPICNQVLEREQEFKQNVSFEEVKTTIFESLVPDSASGKIISSDNDGTIYEKPSEEQSMEYLKTHYNGSYKFIVSLEKEEMQYEKGI